MKLQTLYGICRQQRYSIRCLINCRNHSTSSKPFSRETFLERVSAGPGLQEFFNVKPKLNTPVQSVTQAEENLVPYLPLDSYQGKGRKVHFEIYGCQMNTNDTEVVWSIMKANGYTKAEDIKDADVVMIVTCAVREGAETKIWNRLNHLKAMKEKRSTKKGPLQITVLGCMAERLKHKLLEKEKCVDVVAGPDSYKDLPRLLAISRHYQQSAINVILSLDETYGDVMPVRLNTDSPTAFVSIMRGCDNMCTYCIVPFTRGRERSRDVESIRQEVLHLRDNGVKEVTLLGQNVNSYRDISKETEANVSLAPGFKTVYKPKKGGLPFSVLLQEVAEAVPDVRIRFTSPHPKDFSEEVLRVIRDYPNVCKNLHLPAQSGNNNVLERMRRGYTREAYLQLVDTIREYLPDVGLSSDFICGFCGETEEEFQDTITLIEQVRYNVAFLFAYSMREKTTAHRRYKDDVPLDVKTARLQRMVKAFRQGATELHKMYEGRQELILIEGKSKRSDDCVFGRNDANIKVIVPIKSLPLSCNETESQTKEISVGDFVVAHIEETNSQVLKGQPLYITNLQDFYAKV
ncbi:CDK5RAP1-like protein [Lucilia cuprina]|uniref:CDK5RAP1-like protein n=1 Tax=Lucilia cuprina TaxID=7375 RepID=A0A0L0C6S3_LUCCU|nr:CDK5RAP1-like protein [Lucilia cuprina]KNC27936.1 CDK5RAP1-like protein [Lucilia cuprina]